MSEAKPCFVCGAASSGAPKHEGLATCGECRARMRRARDVRDLALTEEGRPYALWKAIDVGGALAVLGGGFFVATWMDWADDRLTIGGWIALALVLPIGALVFWLILRHDRARPSKWAASSEKQTHDALIAEIRAKLAAAGPASPPTLSDEELIDPRTWSASE